MKLHFQQADLAESVNIVLLHILSNSLPADAKSCAMRYSFILFYT